MADIRIKQTLSMVLRTTDLYCLVWYFKPCYNIDHMFFTVSISSRSRLVRGHSICRFALLGSVQLLCAFLMTFDTPRNAT